MPREGPQWDAIVVGAGPAGCAAAWDLAAANRRVLLVDRAQFPRPKACAGGLTLKAVRSLRYPIDPVVRRWVQAIVLEENAGSAVKVARRKPVCAMTVREELDAYCLAQTQARGAVFRRISAISSIEQKADRLALRLADGTTLEAAFILGADGVHSRVRALMTDAAWFRTGFAIEANVPYRAGEQYPLTFDFSPVNRGYGWLFPRDNHVNIGLYVENKTGESSLNRAALERYITNRCGAGRDFSQPVGQFLGLGAAAYRPLASTRVLLAGDAAGFVDPLTGEGIYGAIRSGQAAAVAIGRALQSSRIQTAVLGRSFNKAAARLQQDLQIAEYGARRFFEDPSRGFQLMRLPLVSRAVLKAYSEGLRLNLLLRGVRLSRALLQLR